MKVYNTLTRQKEEFVPRNDKQVKMFVCGPTVFDYIHLGNARTFVFFDVVAKYLKYRGYDVEYLQNITDIDNKIIARAQTASRNPLEYAKEYTEIFREDILALGVTAVDKYAKASEHIKEVTIQVQKLIDNKNAYLIENDGWYFDLSTFPEYGKLSGRTAQMADDAVSRIDENEGKRNRGDFCLWKFSRPGADIEPAWKSPLGNGRPGWHIEDTAITEHFFGPQYDLHGGGIDLKFPHHEAEIAQQESASGLKPFVKYWLHSGFLVNKEKKMSKSEGNFITVRKALQQYSAQTLRFYFLSAHYRSPLDFSEQALKSSEAAVARISEFIHRPAAEIALAFGGKSQIPSSFLSDFNQAMDDDFNVPRALAVVFEKIKEINSSTLSALWQINEILGIVNTNPVIIPLEIQELVDRRESFRQEKNYTEADSIRKQINSLGWQVDDTGYGALIRKSA